MLRKSALLLGFLAFMITAGSASEAFQASGWEEADQLFRRDPSWVGGDGAYSVDLGNGRVLWLFADTLIDPSGGHSRKSAGIKMISNSLGIQKGYNPATAEMRFFWKTSPDRTPSAFFPDEDNARFWPGHGIRIRDRLILFLMKVKKTTGGLGFEVCDWTAVLIRNPDDDPEDWKMDRLETPSNKLQVIVGSAGVLAGDGFIYAYGSKEPGGADVYLVRWLEDDVYKGDLSRCFWWDGKTWSANEPSVGNTAAAVLHNAGTEFTVHPDPRTGKYMQIQCSGFGPATLTLREAAKPSGPWSEPITLYRPPEYDKPRIMIYQGKAHPCLVGADLVATYSTNSFDFSDLFKDTDTYYPRFVRLWKSRR